MNIKNRTGTCAALIFSAILSGCGGGGGGAAAGEDLSPGSGSGPANSILAVIPGIHGIHVGTFSNGLSHATFVLDNEQFYTMYGIPFNGDLAAIGFLQGDGTLSNGSFSSTNLRDYSTTGAVQSGSLSASFNPGVSLNGSITSGTSTLTFTSVPPQGSPYNFNTAANPAKIIGAWSLKDMQGYAVAMDVAADGSFTGSSSTGCAFNGTMTPRASGKNVFDLALMFGHAPCALPGVPISGIGLEYLLADGRQQFVVAGANPTRTAGIAFLGTR
jgi:hypothetical protein